jgi:hypothetical protein
LNEMIKQIVHLIFIMGDDPLGIANQMHDINGEGIMQIKTNQCKYFI